jgi:hypothetical protein
MPTKITQTFIRLTKEVLVILEQAFTGDHSIQYNYIQHNDIQHNDAQHKGLICDTA